MGPEDIPVKPVEETLECDPNSQQPNDIQPPSFVESDARVQQYSVANKVQTLAADNAYDDSLVEVSQRSDSVDSLNHSPDYISLKSSLGFKCCHINVHSLLPKIDEVRHLVNSLNIHCLSVNETFLDSSIFDHEISIHNYSLFRKDRNRHGGGVALYVQNTFNSVPLDLESHTECIFTVVKSKGRKFIIGSIYRPPNSTAAYYDNIIHDLEKIHSLSTEIILMGDFNYDSFKISDQAKVSEIEYLFQLTQQIKTATRITCHTETLIDHIYISNSVNIDSSGVLPISLSYHYATYAIICINKEIFKTKFVRRRNYNKFNHTEFLSDILNSTIFKEFLQYDDSTIAWENFKHEFLAISDYHAPIRNFKVKMFQTLGLQKIFLNLSIIEISYIERLSLTTIWIHSIFTEKYAIK